MPVVSARALRVTPRWARSCLSRGPTWSRALAMVVAVSSIPTFSPNPSRKQQRLLPGDRCGDHPRLMNTCDVLIVGGGSAGLSAALVLGRARRDVVVVDSGAPRNAPAAHMHGYLSRDGLPPADLLDL